MSWDAHVTAGIGAQSCKVKSAILFGPDGAVWGKHGCSGVDACECKTVAKCVQDGQAIKLEGKKYFYINNIDGYGMFRGGPTSIAGYQSSGHGALIFGCDGISGPECITIATQLREYLKGVGVN